MKLFTVHRQPPKPNQAPSAEGDDPGTDTVFVADGFSLLAFLFPAIWAVWNKLWLVLAGYVLAMLALDGVLQLLNVDPSARALASLVLNGWFGLEAQQLRRWTLQRKNYQEVATVAGSTAEECELAYFAAETEARLSDTGQQAV